MLEFLASGSLPPPVATDTDVTVARRYRRAARCFFTDDDGLLYRRDPVRGTRRSRLCIPTGFEMAVAHLVHASLGHAGVAAMRHAVNARYHWPNVDVTLAAVVRECDCVRRQHHATPFEIGHRPRATVYAAEVSWDLATLTPSKGWRHVLVAVDHYSRRVWLRRLRGLTAAELVDATVDTVLDIGSLPCINHTDNGSNFTSGVCQEVYARLGSRHTRGAAYAAWTQGIVESAVKRMKRALRVLGEENAKDWPDLLPHLAFNLNIAYHSGIGTSPWERATGFPPRLPLDSMLGAQPGPATSSTTARTSRDSTRARQAIALAEKDLLHRIDLRNARAIETGKVQALPVGARVLLHKVWNRKRDGVTKGQWSPWSNAVYRITARPTAYTAEVTNEAGAHHGSRIVHVGRCWPAPDRFVNANTAWAETRARIAMDPEIVTESQYYLGVTPD
jgi:hypothetical protein